jgi:hypothetical protein
MKSKSLYLAVLLATASHPAYSMSFGDIVSGLGEQIKQATQEPQSTSAPPDPHAKQVPAQQSATPTTPTPTQPAIAQSAPVPTQETTPAGPADTAVSPHDLAAAKSGIDSDKLLIWEKGDHQVNDRNYSYQQLNHILATLNKMVDEQLPKPGKFTPPAKDEYEKTTDYQVRVAKAKQDFAAASTPAQREADRFTLLKTYFNPFVEYPEIDSSTSYDADAEILHLTIRPSDSIRAQLLKLPLSIKMSPQQAKIVDYNLHCLIPTIAIEWSASRLTAKYVTFDIGGPYCEGNGIKEISSIFSESPLATGIPVNYVFPQKFDTANANNYDNTLNESDKADTKKDENARKTKKWYKVYQSARTDVPECGDIKKDILNSSVVNGDSPEGEQKTYIHALNYRKTYPLCFRQ